MTERCSRAFRPVPEEAGSHVVLLGGDRLLMAASRAAVPRSCWPIWATSRSWSTSASSRSSKAASPACLCASAVEQRAAPPRPPADPASCPAPRRHRTPPPAPRDRPSCPGAKRRVPGCRSRSVRPRRVGVRRSTTRCRVRRMGRPPAVPHSFALFWSPAGSSSSSGPLGATFASAESSTAKVRTGPGGVSAVSNPNGDAAEPGAPHPAAAVVRMRDVLTGVVPGEVASALRQLDHLRRRVGVLALGEEVVLDPVGE